MSDTNFSYMEVSAKRKKRNQFISVLIIVAIVLLGVIVWGWIELQKSRNAAMLIQSRRVVAFLRDNAIVPWDVAPLPVGTMPANVSHSDGLGIWSGSPRKEGAWRFLEFAMGEEGQKILAGL